MKHRTPFAVALAATLALSLPFAALADDAGSDSTQADEQASADADAPAAQGDAEAEVTVIQVPRPSEEYAGWTYDDVVSELEAAGFTNIVLVPIGDLNFASQIFTHDGTIESVQIGESTGFTRDATFASDTQVTIQYHTTQNSAVDTACQDAYDIAQAYFDAGEYDYASAVFSALGSYSDAATMALRAQEEARVESLLADDSEAQLAQTPRPSSEYVGWSYWDAVTELQEAGFTNIHLAPAGDIVFTLNDGNGKVISVSIDGASDFSDTARFATDAEVSIAFHCYGSDVDIYPDVVALPSSDSDEHYTLGTSTVNTGLDNGYSGSDPIGVDDLNYGWSIGTFAMSGYTSMTSDDDGNPVFLKNVGDEVTLWFDLAENINHLNGDTSLTVCGDTNGYFEDYGIARTDFGRGTLIVRHTDYLNNSEEVVYTDYLTGVSVGADTAIDTYEEGDYEVTLLYELKRSGQRINDLEIGTSYGNYRITFKFSVRNSNCMVFPMDAQTGAELSDGAVTENGFRIDVAQSRYLDITVRRTVLVDGIAGTTEDVRFDRISKNGATYTDPGIYTISVSNRYTGQSTTKTIYVGSEKDYAAYLGTDGE